MTADRIDQIDNCPVGGERALLVEILRDTFASCTTPNPQFDAMLASNLDKLSDDDVKQYLSGLRDRLVKAIL